VKYHAKKSLWTHLIPYLIFGIGIIASGLLGMNDIRKHFDSFDNVPNEKIDRHKECNSISRKQERPGVGQDDVKYHAKKSLWTHLIPYLIFGIGIIASGLLGNVTA
jgi:NADH:ubiquinone oxidoreductase subunit 5 (subunit L)/multisubunit Na+/H+ antiporter MnhA subunit